MTSHPEIARVNAALADLKQGKMVILTDHPDRENEGDLIMAAELTTPEAINFMIRHGSGIICLPLTASQLNKLSLPLMVAPHENSSQKGTPFTVSIEAKDGITTGVSAKDRATTILTAIADHVQAQDIVKPGHIFPLQARDGGVLERPGHTEGSIDLVRIAGFKPASVICEVMNPDGTMSKGAELVKFAETHQLKMLSIDDIITYRRLHENLIEEEVSAELPTESLGEFKITVIREKISGHEHVILSKENPKLNAPLLVRVHSACMTGDMFDSKRCDCSQQLNYSMRRISNEGGLLIYLKQEGRGIGLFNKIKAYNLQEQGLDTIEANQKLGMPIDSRNYHMVANILRNRGVDSIRLLTNNPSKISDIKKYGIEKVEREAIPVFCNEYNNKYLQTKKDKLNHLMQDLLPVKEMAP